MNKWYRFASTQKTPENVFGTNWNRIQLNPTRKYCSQFQINSFFILLLFCHRTFSTFYLYTYSIWSTSTRNVSNSLNHKGFSHLAWNIFFYDVKYFVAFKTVKKGKRKSVCLGMCVCAPFEWKNAKALAVLGTRSQSFSLDLNGLNIFTTNTRREREGKNSQWIPHKWLSTSANFCIWLRILGSIFSCFPPASVFLAIPHLNRKEKWTIKTCWKLIKTNSN